MKPSISGGLRDGNVEVGNTFDKYGSRNPLVRWMMRGFTAALDAGVTQASPHTIHEVGCGEGYWVLRWLDRGIDARGTDFSPVVLDLAQKNATAAGQPVDRFGARSIYDLTVADDRADLLVCCEVLEHLEAPEDALRILGEVAGRHVLLSVPREPIWRILNMTRGKYWRRFGNTPGHIQHWSRGAFLTMVSRHLEVVRVFNPFPWTMVLCERHSD